MYVPVTGPKGPSKVRHLAPRDISTVTGLDGEEPYTGKQAPIAPLAGYDIPQKELFGKSINVPPNVTLDASEHNNYVEMVPKSQVTKHASRTTSQSTQHLLSHIASKKHVLSSRCAYMDSLSSAKNCDRSARSRKARLCKARDCASDCSSSCSSVKSDSSQKPPVRAGEDVRLLHRPLPLPPASEAPPPYESDDSASLRTCAKTSNSGVAHV